MTDAPTQRRDLSIVVCCYEMERELPKTLLSLSRAYQRGVEQLNYEVIVVDNGSRDSPRQELFEDLDLDLTVVKAPDPTQSPVGALNHAIGRCVGDWIAVFIDGARMASPGLVATCMKAGRLHVRPIVATQSLMLGLSPQWKAETSGYDQTEEDALLSSISWPDDGYRLFEIATWYANSEGEMRWIAPLLESNAIFMPRALWSELGGYDMAFQSAGGGCASMDLFRRAWSLPSSQPIAIIGEATFHQIHSTSATNAHADVTGQIKKFSREYYQVRKTPLKLYDGDIWMFGTRSVVAANRQTLATLSKQASSKRADQYLGLLERTLLQERITLDGPNAPRPPRAGEMAAALMKRPSRISVDQEKVFGFHASEPPRNYTMIGKDRLRDLGSCVKSVVDEGVPGDLIECGVWHGGASAYMKGVLQAYNARGRTVWLADTFAGLPPPREADDDGLDLTPAVRPDLVASLDAVRANFADLGLLDDEVRFLPGLFADTLRSAPIERLAILRIDADLHSSTMDALDALYDKVSPGGYIVVDDYGFVPQCRAAVDAFRARKGVTNPIHKIDYTGIRWRKTKEPD